jgi:hypothetical protein
LSTPNLAIPHILQSQAQKEVTANAAFDALDQAIAGLLEVDVSTGGMITPDPADAVRCKLLRLTGTLAADAEVVVPSNKKPYFLHNATTGGFAVTVRTAAGAGVTVGASPDDTAVAFCDGTDVLAISLGGEESADLPYDPAMFIPGTHGSGALIAQIVFPRTATFPAGFAGSQAYAQVPAIASTTLDVQQNGTSIGSITFGAGSSSATFSLAADTVFAPGDRLAIVNQDPADATLADLSITLKGTR